MYESHYGIEKMAAERCKSLRTARGLDLKGNRARVSLIIIAGCTAMSIIIKGI